MWTFSTNWTIAGGSPATIINFIASEDNQTMSESSPKSTTTRNPNPLILKPKPSADNCEIKVSFMDRHEITKIYVRSTALVYEVHYAPALESNDVYLCTVECTMASREEDVHASNDEQNREVISENSKVSIEDIASKSSIDSTEDEWEVIGRNSLPPHQDFYEAATLINNAGSCISVTLCLRSPHSKELIHIDEVRVFADVLEPSDSESKSIQGDKSEGSTQIADLGLTLCDLSISGAGCLQDEHASSVVDVQGTLSGAPGSTETESGAEPDANCEMPNQISQSQSQAQASDREEKTSDTEETTSDKEGKTSDREEKIPDKEEKIPDREEKTSDEEEKTSDREEKHDFPCGHVKKVLEQVLCKLSKLEDLFLAFEKNTLKPINSMEARLQKVEEYMELVGKNSKTYKPGGDDASASGSQFVPRLVVTAPAFSCDEDEDVFLSEPPKTFSQGHAKVTSPAVDNPFSSFTRQSPQMSPCPSVSVPVLGDFDREEFGQPAETRNRVLESLLGGFGQARQIGTGLPQTVATPINTPGSGFSGFKSNGFSKAASQGGSFVSQASADKVYVDAVSSAGESSTVPTAGGCPTDASGSGFSSWGTSSAAASAGIFGPCSSTSDVPVAAFGSGSTAGETSFSVPTSASGGEFIFPGTTSGGTYTSAATTSGGTYTSAATTSDDQAAAFGSGFGVPTTASVNGYIAPPTIFKFPSTSSGGGWFPPATNSGVPTTSFSGGRLFGSSPSFGFSAPTTSGSGVFGSSPSFGFGAPTTSSGSGVSGSSPSFGFGAPTTSSGSGLFGSSPSFGAPTSYGSGLFGSSPSFGAPTTSTGDGMPFYRSSLTVPTTSSSGRLIGFGAPATSSSGSSTDPTPPSFSVPAAAFGGGNHFSGIWS